MSCSLSAVIDLNKSLSQLSLSPRHSRANQLPRHDALRGGGERHRECQRGRDKERNPEGRRDGGRRKGCPEPTLEEELICLEDKTLFPFFLSFFCLCSFHVSHFSPKCKQKLTNTPFPFISGPCLSPHSTSPSSLQ